MSSLQRASIALGFGLTVFTLGSCAEPEAAPTAYALSSGEKPIALGLEAISVVLDSGAWPNDLRELAETSHILLVLSDLAAESQPGVIYELYLGVLEGDELSAEHFVDTINFYAAVALEDAERAPDIDLTFDVSTLVRDAARRGAFVPTVTIVPDGEPAADANASIGRIELVIH